MADKILIPVLVVIEAERTDDEPVHVKEWWIQTQLMNELQKQMPVINSQISDTTLKIDSIKVVK